MFKMSNVVLNGDVFASGIITVSAKISVNAVAKAAKQQIPITYEFDLAGAKLEPVMKKATEKWVIVCAQPLRKKGEAYIRAHETQKVLVAEMGTKTGGFKNETETVSTFISKMTPDQLKEFSRNPALFMEKMIAESKANVK